MTRLDFHLTDNSDAEAAQHDWEAAQEKLDAAIDACASDVELLTLFSEVMTHRTRHALVDILMSDTTEVTAAVLRWADK